MPTAIRIEHLYKEYRLGVIGRGTLYRDLQSWWAIARGREDPNSLIGSGPNVRVRDSILALKDINLEVEEGEALGIIGANGAGKSTLLKILSRVTTPSRGSIKYKGRISSLLEVGTGFHPELTGRENIYLNGAIHGMRRQEITKKLEEIVDFAGVEKFLDTPVKRYSSGMYVRLGFAVAAHLDPDILVVDEVLAVGDAAFQRKAVDKMQDVSTKGGRTVLFVSHNMVSVENLCKTAILIDQGRIAHQGPSTETITRYLNQEDDSRLPSSVAITARHSILKSVRLLDKANNETSAFDPGDRIVFDLSIDTNDRSLLSPRILITVLNKKYGNICKFITSQMIAEPFIVRGKTSVKCIWHSCLLTPGVYDVHVKITGTQSGSGQETFRNIISFKVTDKSPYKTGRGLAGEIDTILFPDGQWVFDRWS